MSPSSSSIHNVRSVWPSPPHPSRGKRALEQRDLGAGARKEGGGRGAGGTGTDDGDVHGARDCMARRGAPARYSTSGTSPAVTPPAVATSAAATTSAGSSTCHSAGPRPL